MSALDPLTAGLELGGDLVNGAASIFGQVLSTTQTRRLDETVQKAHDDVQGFKNDLLARDVAALNLRLDGLQHGVPVDVTAAESDQLRDTSIDITAFALLGLYVRARAADLAADRDQILRDTASTLNPK